MIGTIVGAIAAAAVLQAAGVDGRRGDVCDLLAAAELRAVQGVAVQGRKASAVSREGLRILHCVFAAVDPARSVSLTVIAGDARGRAAAVREYWGRTFRPRRENPARPLTGVGDEAFWTGDGRVGVLYVRSRGVVLRISVGGVRDEPERIRRSRAVARAALARLRGSPGWLYNGGRE